MLYDLAIVIFCYFRVSPVFCWRASRKLFDLSEKGTFASKTALITDIIAAFICVTQEIKSFFAPYGGNDGGKIFPEYSIDNGGNVIGRIAYCFRNVTNVYFFGYMLGNVFYDVSRNFMIFGDTGKLNCF